MVSPTSKQVLLDTLLRLNDPSKPFRITQGADSDLVAEWKLDDTEWQSRFAKTGLARMYKACLVADEGRRSVRCWEQFGRVSWTGGDTQRFVPVVSYGGRQLPIRVPYYWANARILGLAQSSFSSAVTSHNRFDINEIRGALMVTVEECGWEWVPVAGRQHATHASVRPISAPFPAGRIFCENCGRRIAAGSTYCPHCGDKQKE